MEKHFIGILGIDEDDDFSETDRDLSICAWNVHGLVGRGNAKIQDPTFLATLQNFDIILMTETWINKNSTIDIKNMIIKLFHMTRRQGAKRDSGGIAVYYRSDLATGVQLVRSTEDCVLWLKISKEILHSDKDLLICTCYILPTNSGRRNITCDVLEKNKR